jgi:hypothetical protein
MTKNLVCLAKFLNLFIWHAILDLAICIPGFEVKGGATLVGQVEEKMVFFFSTFLGLMGHLL